MPSCLSLVSQLPALQVAVTHGPRLQSVPFCLLVVSQRPALQTVNAQGLLLGQEPQSMDFDAAQLPLTQGAAPQLLMASVEPHSQSRREQICSGVSGTHASSPADPASPAPVSADPAPSKGWPAASRPPKPAASESEPSAGWPPVP